MRVHELDEKYGVSKEAVKEALVLAGLKTHHMTDLDESELVQFEAALENGKDGVKDFENALEGLPVIKEEDSEPEPLPEVTGEELEHPGTGVEMEPVEPGSDLVADGSGTESEPGPEKMPPEDTFPVVSDAGVYQEDCHLPPDLAAKVRAILKPGHRINSYLLKPERKEFVFIVWETAQEHRIRL